MLSLLVLKEFFDTKTGRMVALIGVGCVAFAIWLFAHDQRVTSKAVANITKANDHAIKKGTAAADRARAGGVRLPIDPHTRDD